MNDLPLICIQNVSFTYANGTRALKHVNLRINKGELIAIMGPNGAGKTTLIRLLNGLLRPTEGNVFIEGKNARNKTIAELSKKVGIIFQNPSHQLFSATVEQEIIFSLKNLGLNKEEIRTKKDEILHEFGFEKYKERSPLTLSGGEAKKLALASIVCRDPEIIVFDEPTLGQDAKEIEFFIKLIKEERKKEKTIIIVTHDIEFALEHAPRVILMANGTIMADGPATGILVNEYLVKLSSLILPQLYQYKKGLIEMGFKVPENLLRLSEFKEFLSKLFNSKLKDKVVT